jgi:hypothetical protein
VGVVGWFQGPILYIIYNESDQIGDHDSRQSTVCGSLSPNQYITCCGLLLLLLLIVIVCVRVTRGLISFEEERRVEMDG